MKSIIITAIAFVSGPLFSFAQETNKVKVNTGEKTLLSGCLNKTFLDGKVFYKEGGYGKAKLNYNCITQEMLFINAQGDTLKLNKPEETSMVTIASDTLCFFKNTFIKKITHYSGGINLYRKMDLKHSYNEKKQAYGYSAVTGDQSSTTFVNSMGGINYLEVDENLIYTRSGDMYISNDKGDFSQLKQAGFNKIYPQFKVQIAAFIKNNKTDWDEMNDIMKLMEYLQQLSQTKPLTQ